MVNTIGIDLGTSKCCVGVFRGDKVEIIPNEFGNHLTPSFVAFTNSDRIIGDGAKNQVNANPYNTIHTALRLIGRKFEDPVVQSDMKNWSFKVISDAKGRPKVLIVFEHHTKHFYPEEIIAMLLAQLKESAETHLKAVVKDAVVTVPASFNYSQRQAIKDAGAIAGLNIVRVVAAPTAAAMAYGFGKRAAIERNVLVFDLGGGTLDVSIVSVIDATHEVKATAGNGHLGGEEFGNLLVDHFVAEIKKKYGKDLTFDPRAIRRLRTACEAAKHTLSSCTTASINLDHLFDGVNFCSSINRNQFEKLCSPLFGKIMGPVKKALADAKLKKSKIHDVVLAGGSTRIPFILNVVSKFFSAKQMKKSINPDEAAACGAAIEGAIISGDKCDLLKRLILLDALPVSLGVNYGKNDTMVPIIKRNRAVPTRTSKMFTLKGKIRGDLWIQIYEGEGTKTKDNTFLGAFALEDITSSFWSSLWCPTKLKITFEIGIDGILTAKAEDKSPNNKASSSSMIVTNQHNRFTKAELADMVDEAKKLKREDEFRRKCVATRIGLEDYCFHLKNLANELLNTVPEDNRQKVYKKCDEVLAWIDDNQFAATEELEYQQMELMNVHTQFLPVLTSESVDAQVYKKCKNALVWIDRNPRAKPEDVQRQLKEVEALSGANGV